MQSLLENEGAGNGVGDGRKISDDGLLLLVLVARFQRSFLPFRLQIRRRIEFDLPAEESFDFLLLLSLPFLFFFFLSVFISCGLRMSRHSN